MKKKYRYLVYLRLGFMDRPTDVRAFDFAVSGLGVLTDFPTSFDVKIMTTHMPTHI